MAKFGVGVRALDEGTLEIDGELPAQMTEAQEAAFRAAYGIGPKRDMEAELADDPEALARYRAGLENPAEVELDDDDD